MQARGLVPLAFVADVPRSIDPDGRVVMVSHA